ncbi:MAG: hypothetical protein IRZ04_04045 [Rhodospirillales bacterium]|nr:hypothetical protein [Rhodospirillales bacterium]
MLKHIAAVAALAVLLTACEGRFVGFDNCSADGSVVWWEMPNSRGSYEGLDNNPQNCRK